MLPARAGALATLALLATTGAGLPQEAPPDDAEILGSAAAFSLEGSTAERVALEAGTFLYSRPDAESQRLAQIDAPTEIEVLASEGDWFRIRYLGRLGWVNPQLPRRGLELEATLAPLAVAAPTFVERSVERRRLAAEALGVDGPNGALGPYRLMTDVSETPLLTRLGEVVDGLAGSYRERFGLEPAPADEQYVILFRDEDAYRRYEASATGLAAYGALGHAGADLAVLFVGENDLDTVTSLVIHELTHLMNRSTLGETPPPWLEEGMANDLAYCRIDNSGRIRLGTLGGSTTVFGDRFGSLLQYTGAKAALRLVLETRARRDATPLAELVSLGQDAFLDGERRELRYAESTFWLRFLLEGERGRYADGLERYVERAAVGKVEPAELERLLGADWARLERDFARWLELQSIGLQR